MHSHEEIVRLLAQYSQLLDDGRLDEWSELFTPDGAFSFWGKTHRGRHAIKASMTSPSDSQPQLGKHLVSQPIVVEQKDRLFVWSDFIGLHTAQGVITVVAT